MSRFSESDAGKIAELLYPYKGYKNAMLVKYWSSMCKWEVEVCGSGKHLWLYDDEFELV